MSNEQNRRVQVREVTTLSENWGKLKKTVLDYQRRDGQWQTLTRETYDRGNGAVILLYNRAQRTVVLIRQFRYPCYVNPPHNALIGSYNGMLIEACAGLLDLDNPEALIRREAEEETGYHVENVERVMEVYMSPGSVTERIYFLVAEYEPDMRGGEGGGLYDDGEDIDVLELDIEAALAMVKSGEIMDGKTIMLLQWVKLNVFTS